MKYYAFYEADGMVRFIAHDPTYSTLPYVDIGEVVPDAFIHYVDGGVFKSAPNPPGDNYDFDPVTKTWIQNTAAAWAAVRSKRDAFLTACDWVQLPDVPLAAKASWTTYRQSLRDITKQIDPSAIEWPIAP